MATQDDLESIFQRIVEKVAPSVVRIGRGSGRGAGVVVTDGRILTNAHNLRGAEVTVTFADGRSTSVPVLGADLDGDMALLDAGAGTAPALSWDPAAAEVHLGQLVLTVTNVGEVGTRVTAGYVSATDRAFRGPRGRRIRGGFEHTAPLGPGSSGGPVVDSSGHLVGIDTHRLGEGFYLAVPADAELAARVELLAKGGAPRRVRLGIGVAPSEAARRMRGAVGLPERDGVLVRVVEAGSPAERAGIRQGDLIWRIGDHEVRSGDDLFDALGKLSEADSVEISLVRGVEDIVLDVALGEVPAPGTETEEPGTETEEPGTEPEEPPGG